MPTQRHYARVHRAALIQDLLDQLEPIGERVGNQSERVLKNLISKTLRFSSQFGTSGKTSPYAKGAKATQLTYGFSDAQVDIQKKITVNKKGLKLEMAATVMDGGGKPHFVWHLISEGRPSFRQRRTSPPIRERSGLRTTPDTLEVRGFPGFTGEVFVIPAGTVVDAIPPRRWYEAADKAFRIEFRKFAAAEIIGLLITSSKIQKLARHS